jgi:hypothetical protein
VLDPGIEQRAVTHADPPPTTAFHPQQTNEGSQGASALENQSGGPEWPGWAQRGPIPSAVNSLDDADGRVPVG